MKAKIIATLAFLLCFGGLLPEKAEARPYGRGYYVTRTVGYDYYGRPILRRVWVEIGPRYYAPPVRHYHHHHRGHHYHRGHHHKHHRHHHYNHSRGHGKSHNHGKKHHHRR